MRFREYFIFSILIILGLSIIVLDQQLANEKYSPYLNALASTALISGLLGALYKKYIDGIHYQEIRKLLKIHESIEDSGLLEYHKKSNEYNYANLINNSKELTVVVNDGLKWINNNANDIRNRFNRKTTTTFVHLDPESKFIPALAEKVGYTVEEFIKKLEMAKKELINLYDESDKRGTLEIFQFKTYPTKSIYLTESILVITPYQAAAKRLNIPVFVYDATNWNSGYYKDVVIDLNHIYTESNKVYPIA